MTFAMRIRRVGEIDDGTELIAVEINAHASIGLYPEDAFEITFGSLLESVVNRFNSQHLMGAKDQIHQRHIGRRHANRCAVNFTFELR